MHVCAWLPCEWLGMARVLLVVLGASQQNSSRLDTPPRPLSRAADFHSLVQFTRILWDFRCEFCAQRIYLSWLLWKMLIVVS